MLKRCENRCGRIFDDGGRLGEFDCSPECRAARHAKLKRTPCSDQPAPPAAYSTSPTLAPTRRSTSEAWRELAARAADIPDSLVVDNRAAALETRRRVLSSPRPDLSPHRR